jgi:hypothetical protein
MGLHGTIPRSLTFRSLACLFWLGVATSVGLAALASSTACSSACVDEECAAGNRCLPFHGETKCRKTCSSNSIAAESCPFGHTCTDPLIAGVPPFCLQDQAGVSAKPSGLWGQRCQANLGLDNPACDGSQGFLCYAVSPTDPNAYCTRYDCTRDEQCGAGFYCGVINQTPNISTARRKTIGEVQNVCLKRTFCAPCRVNLDCPTIEGTAQFCVPDATGAGFCAPECTSSESCASEAKCGDVGIGTKVCFPRSNVCVGDGSLCSSCRVDTDCGDDGICVKGEKTTEKACAKKAPNNDCNKCEDKISTPARTIGCAKTNSDLLPAGYCVGLYEIGGDVADLGCWTPNR